MFSANINKVGPANRSDVGAGKSFAFVFIKVPKQTEGGGDGGAVRGAKVKVSKR